MISIPLVYEYHEGKPGSVAVYVDGTAAGESVRFMLDTGATICAVPSIGSISDLPAAGADTGRGASGTVTGDDLVTLAELRIGDLVWRNVTAARVSNPSAPPLLGMNVLGSHRCHFRYSTRELVIDDSNVDASESHALVQQAGGQPMLDVTIDDITVRACWDSGASLSVVGKHLMEAHPHLFELGTDSAGFDAAGTQISTIEARMAACRIGASAFEPSACVVIDLAMVNAEVDDPMDMIIGMPLLAQADWEFDFPVGTWRFTTPSVSASHDLAAR